MAIHEHHQHPEHGSELSEMQVRVRALESVLTEKGYIDPAALDAIIEAYETKLLKDVTEEEMSSIVSSTSKIMANYARLMREDRDPAQVLRTEASSQ